MAIKRSTAYRVRIADIINNQFIKQEGFNPSYIELGKNQVSRVNLISTVVGKYTSDDENYSALTLDDGTETIRVKGFGPEVFKLKNVNVGQIIRLVGKIKEYNDEKYLTCEVATVLDSNWIIVNELELGKIVPVEKAFVVEKKFENSVEQPITVDSIESENLNIKILNLIRDEDKGSGAMTETVLSKSGLSDESAKDILFALLKSGEIFEPKKGILKILD